MKFGKVDTPENINFELPGDHQRTTNTLSKFGNKEISTIYVGCAKIL